MISNFSSLWPRRHLLFQLDRLPLKPVSPVDRRRRQSGILDQKLVQTGLAVRSDVGLDIEFDVKTKAGLDH